MDTVPLWYCICKMRNKIGFDDILKRDFGFVQNCTYSVTPELHMSTLKPANVSSPLAISGGWKAGEPCPVEHVSSAANIDNASATPKSEIFSVSSKVISRLPGLMSLWIYEVKFFDEKLKIVRMPFASDSLTIPLPCKYSSPSINCKKYRCAWYNDIFFSGTESNISYIPNSQKKKQKKN